MNTRKQKRYQAVLERLSFGAVPVDGIYWLDPKEAAGAAAPQRHAGPDKGRHPRGQLLPLRIGGTKP
jgi:hypothetical protein